MEVKNNFKNCHKTFQSTQNETETYYLYIVENCKLELFREEVDKKYINFFTEYSAVILKKFTELKEVEKKYFIPNLSFEEYNNDDFDFFVIVFENDLENTYVIENGLNFPFILKNIVSKLKNFTNSDMYENV